jgi:hypothetical protein
VTERRYVLTRIAAGDYVVPSNDGRTLWRIYEYDEAPEGAGRFWAAARWTRPMPVGEIPEDFLDWDNWETYAGPLRTRAEAIDAALSASDKLETKRRK